MLVFAGKTGEGIWVKYQQGKDGVSIKIRPLTADDSRRIRKESLVKSMGFEQGRKVSREIPDPELFDKLCFRHAVEDWKGVVDPDGNPILRSDEMVDAVCGSLNGLASWILDQAMELADGEAERKGNELKNSKASHEASAQGQVE